MTYHIIHYRHKGKHVSVNSYGDLLDAQVRVTRIREKYGITALIDAIPRLMAKH